jgi:hypothetical protein
VADPLATSDDVAAVLVRPLTAAETSYVDALIANVSALARKKVPQLDQYIADGRVDESLAAFAVAMVVRRLLLNPEGASQHSVSVGPFVESITHSTDTRNEQGTFTDEELSWLKPAAPLGFGTISMTAGLEDRGRDAERRWALQWDRFLAARA